MARIFNVQDQGKLPDISNIPSVLDIPNMEFESIESALDSYATLEGNEIDMAEENFSKLSSFQDQLTGEKFDTDTQRETFNRVKGEIGIDDNAFNVSMDDLRDPYTVRNIESKLGELYKRPEVRDILLEQEFASNYLKELQKYEHINPGLYKMGLKKYNDYRMGNVDPTTGRPISGFDLLPQEYRPIDLADTVDKLIKMLPEVETSEMKFENGLSYELATKQRVEEDVDKLLEAAMEDPVFANNVKAGGPNYYKQLRQALIEGHTRINTDISNVRQSSGGSGGRGTESERLFKSFEDKIRNTGGDVSRGIVRTDNGEEASLTEYDLKMASKYFRSMQEDEDEIRITYAKDSKSGETTIIIPKDPSQARVLDPQYQVKLSSGRSTDVKQSDLKSWLKLNPKVTSRDYPAGAGLFSGTNKGDDSIVKIEDGKLITNNVKFLKDMGIVGGNVSFHELGNQGFTYGKAGKSDVAYIDVSQLDGGSIQISPESIEQNLNKEINYKEVPTKGYTSVGAKNLLNLRPYGKNNSFKSYDSYEDALIDGVKLMDRYYSGKSGPLKEKKKHLWNTENEPVTLEEVIRTWSPSKEDCVNGNCGDTTESVVKSYVSTVAEKIGVSPDTPVEQIGIVELTKAMASHECPKCIVEVEKEYGSFEDLFNKAFGNTAEVEPMEEQGEEVDDADLNPFEKAAKGKYKKGEPSQRGNVNQSPPAPNTTETDVQEEVIEPAEIDTTAHKDLLHYDQSDVGSGWVSLDEDFSSVEGLEAIAGLYKDTVRSFKDGVELDQDKLEELYEMLENELSKTTSPKVKKALRVSMAKLILMGETPSGGSDGELKKKASVILNKHKDLNFVDRILNSEKYSDIKNEDGTVSTHLMAVEYDENVGEWIMFPTIIQDKSGSLKELDHMDAWDYAIKNKQYVPLGKDKEFALWMGEEGYKKVK